MFSSQKSPNSLIFSGERDTKICGNANIPCYKNAQNKLFGEDVIDGLRDSFAKTFRRACNCLPSCTSIVYDAEIDKTKLNFVEVVKSYGVPLEQIERYKS